MIMDEMMIQAIKAIAEFPLEEDNTKQRRKG
jgi:hypothetical protein